MEAKKQRIEQEFDEPPPPASMDMNDANDVSSDLPSEINSDDDLFKTVAAVVGMDKGDPKRAEAVSRIDQYLSSTTGQSSIPGGDDQPMGEALGQGMAI